MKGTRMTFAWPGNLPKLSLWDIACCHTGQNAQDLTPTNETRHKLAELVQASRANPPNNLPIEFIQPGNDHGFVTGLAADGNRAAANADWRKLDQVTVRHDDWEEYQASMNRPSEEDLALIGKSSEDWDAMTNSERQEVVQAIAETHSFVTQSLAQAEFLKSHIEGMEDYRPVQLYVGPGYSEKALKLTTLSRYTDLETWHPAMAAMLVAGLQAPYPICTEISRIEVRNLRGEMIRRNWPPFREAERVFAIWNSRTDAPVKVAPLDFITWCKTKNIDTAWLLSIEEEAQQSRDSVMSNDKYGIVQLPDVRLIHPELLAQLIAYAKSPIPDDTRLHGPLKKETPDGPHQWKIEPLSGEDWQLVNKLCGGKPPAPCSPQQFEEWRVPFDTRSEKPKWDFHPEFQPSDAMQRAQSQWNAIYSEHLRQLRETIAVEKLDLWTMDGLRTTDVYDHAGLAYGHMRIDDAKAYLARCSILYALSIGDLSCTEGKTAATILETTLPPPDHLLTLDGLANAICPGEGREFDRHHWKQAMRQACSGDNPALIARYADGREVEAGTLGAQNGAGTHILSRDAAKWLESKGWTVKHEQRLQIERPAAVPPKLTPDWDIWRHALKATLRDAVCLSCNAEPKTVAIGSVEYGLGQFLNQVVSLPVASKEVCDEISCRLQIAQSHTGPGGTLQTVTGEKDGEVKLAVFAQWAIDTMKWTVPNELRALTCTAESSAQSEQDEYVFLAKAAHLLAQRQASEMQASDLSWDEGIVLVYEKMWQTVIDHLLKQDATPPMKEKTLPLWARHQDGEEVNFQPTTELQGAWIAKKVLHRIFANPPREIIEKLDKKRKDADEEAKQREATRRAAGRYTLGEAAGILDERGGERKVAMSRKLCDAAFKGELPVYEPGRNARYEYGQGKDAKIVRDSYEEARWDELNQWLEKNEPHITFRFPAPVSVVSQDAPNPNGQLAGDDGEASGQVGTNSADWKAQARLIADELFNHDTNQGTRDSLGGYAKRVMEKMQERQIHGPRGRITNANTVKREALQGDKWWQKKNK